MRSLSQYNKDYRYEFAANGQKLDSESAQKPADNDPNVYVTPRRTYRNPYLQEWISSLFIKGGTLYARSRRDLPERPAASNLLTMTDYKGEYDKERPYSTSYYAYLSYGANYVLRCEMSGVSGSAVQIVTWCP